MSTRDLGVTKRKVVITVAFTFNLPLTSCSCFFLQLKWEIATTAVAELIHFRGSLLEKLYDRKCCVCSGCDSVNGRQTSSVANLSSTAENGK